MRRLRLFPLLLIAGLFWLLAGGRALAAGLPVAGAPSVDLWSHVSVLRDPAHALGVDQAIARADDFRAPEGTPKNLGVTTDAVWLRVPLDVAEAGAGDWVLHLDYPAINRVDAYLLDAGRVRAAHRLGNAMPFGARPMPSRAHAAAVELRAGAGQELLLRVQTTSSMVLPLTLDRPRAFQAHEAAMQLLQGVLVGIALAMVLYSLAQWATLRDRLFLYYALTVGATVTFFISFSGIGQQYLWPDAPGLAARIAPLAVLVAAAAAAPFLSGSLAMREASPRADRVLRIIGWLAFAAFAAGALGLLDYRLVQGLATVLGPSVVAISARAAWRLARGGDRVGTYMLAGWATYLFGVAVMAGVLRGVVEPGFWTLHLYQLCSTVEMGAWMAVIGVRVDEMRRAADRARLESEALRSMAHTDALTGLPNRRGLALQLDAALRHTAPDRALAVYLIDLDGFKPVNDRFGHDVGDALLVAVAARLRGAVRGSDVVARLGGDEFVVLAAGLPDDAAARQIGTKLLETAQVPFEIGAHRCEIGMTIGYALAPQDGRDADGLLKRADAAMYAGKQDGRRQLRRGGASLAMAAA
jgi:diguanylate cyclase (GGDEF)-like protein